MLVILLVSAHGKIYHRLQTAPAGTKSLEWQFLSVWAVDVAGTREGCLPCWEPNGITSSFPSLLVLVVIDSTSSPKVSANQNALVASSLTSFFCFWNFNLLATVWQHLLVLWLPFLFYCLLEDWHFLLFWPHHLLNVSHLHLKWLSSLMRSPQLSNSPCTDCNFPWSSFNWRESACFAQVVFFVVHLLSFH